MKIYLVGGAVRDKLLGLPVREKDWVVVGATSADLLRQGFRQVGRDFPVFLHPKTNEEYALARKERKVSPGYTGFIFDASQEVTLEEDLQRRDLTINAIAETPEGELIDPFNGKQDLDLKQLRHVSESFIEDPVRILRAARFAARFASLGFKVAPETLFLMRTMVAAGEVDALVPERVWREVERALTEPNPEVFFRVLVECGAYERLFPAEWLAGEAALVNAVALTSRALIRFAAFSHVLTDRAVAHLAERYRLPNEFTALAQLVCRYQSRYFNVLSATAEEMIDFLQAVDAFRRKDRFEAWLIAMQACLTGVERALLLQKCLHAAQKIDVGAVIKGVKKEAIPGKIREARLASVAAILKQRAP